MGAQLMCNALCIRRKQGASMVLSSLDPITRIRLMSRAIRLLLASALIMALWTPVPSHAQEVIYLVRHAEQVPNAEDPPLTSVGEARARALANFLKDAGIIAVYSSQAQRTRRTAQPTADLLGLQLRLIDREETGGLISSIRQHGVAGRVLVVAHSETVPIILRALGHTEDVVIDRSDYENVFVVVPQPDRPPVVIRQRLSVAPET
jgi:broad specificity phosphatase PhoE